jgi:DNA replication and repair protein RecF
MSAASTAPAAPAVTRIKLRHFRCFEQCETEFAPGANFIIGPNARGKTSILEGVCILLRLQSPRVTTLARVIQHERRGFVADGFFGARHLQFYYSRERKKLALDGVEQSGAREWLQIARVMWFGNEDIDIVRGAGEQRRRFLDFVAAQQHPSYAITLRAYQHALRSRNHLLKQPSIRWREVAAFDGPLLEHGAALTAARRELIAALQTVSEAAHSEISGRSEKLGLDYLTGTGDDFAQALSAARSEDARLRQTTIGPHRDDLRFSLNAISSADSSEGQQRTLVLALKVGACRILERHFGIPPVLLIDDIFGELDAARRNALLAALPSSAQRIITTTQVQWIPSTAGMHVLDLSK